MLSDELRDELDAEFGDDFMKWNIHKFAGVRMFDEDDVIEDPNGSELKYWSRLSAPGYMDRTDWLGPYDTADEAAEELLRCYGRDS